jgi:ribonucleoside-triphosphate reductase
MTDRKAKEARLTELKAELMGVQGTPTEVYSRIVGYYRSVRNWNAGKRHEYTKRKTYEFARVGMGLGSAFIASGVAAGVAAGAAASSAVGAAQASAVVQGGAHEAYLLFTRKSCPNCAPVKDYLAGTGLKATFIDVDTPEGFEAAKRHNVMSTPTAILVGAKGNETARAYSNAQLAAALGPARAAVRV